MASISRNFGGGVKGGVERVSCPAFHPLSEAAPGWSQVMTVATARAVEVDEPDVVAFCKSAQVRSVVVVLFFIPQYFL